MAPTKGIIMLLNHLLIVSLSFLFLSLADVGLASNANFKLMPIAWNANNQPSEFAVIDDKMDMYIIQDENNFNEIAPVRGNYFRLMALALRFLKNPEWMQSFLKNPQLELALASQELDNEHINADTGLIGEYKEARSIWTTPKNSVIGIRANGDISFSSYDTFLQNKLAGHVVGINFSGGSVSDVYYYLGEKGAQKILGTEIIPQFANLPWSISNARLSIVNHPIGINTELKNIVEVFLPELTF